MRSLISLFSRASTPRRLVDILVSHLEEQNLHFGLDSWAEN